MFSSLGSYLIKICSTKVSLQVLLKKIEIFPVGLIIFFAKILLHGLCVFALGSQNPSTSRKVS